MAPLPGTEGVLKRATIINENMWIVYCCCSGWGVTGKIADPLVAAEVKELCIRTSVNTTDIMGDDGLCSQVQICLCITEQCQLPPLKEAPVCACFNKKCGGSIGSTAWNKQIFDESPIMNDTFWIYYFLCGGCGINKMDQGLFGAQFKELCCRGYTNLEPPVIDGIACASVGKELCIQSECSMPPQKPNPMIAICTWRMNKDQA